MSLNKNTKNQALSTMELVVAIAVFTLISMGFAATLSYNSRLLSLSKARVAAMAIADDKIESLRAMPYSQVGVAGSVPSGTLPATEAFNVDSINYTINNSVTWTDDPKDGLGASDQDGNPHDYKTYKIKISWTQHSKNYTHSRITKIYAPY